MENKFEKITTDRLNGWKNKLVKSNATPMMLLGIGHGQNQGQLVICITEDCSDATLKKFLKLALSQLK